MAIELLVDVAWIVCRDGEVGVVVMVVGGEEEEEERGYSVEKESEGGEREEERGSDSEVLLGDSLMGVCSVVLPVVVVVGGSVANGTVVGASVVVVVGFIRHSPDLKSHSCCGHESHFNLQSRP